jgi:hypothetical protein
MKQSGIHLIWGTVPKCSRRDWSKQTKPRLGCSVSWSRFDTMISRLHSKLTPAPPHVEKASSFVERGRLIKYCIHRRLLTDPTANNLNPVHILTPCFSKIPFLNNLPINTYVPSLLISPSNFCVHLFYPMRAAYLSVYDQFSWISHFWSIYIHLLYSINVVIVFNMMPG